MKLVVRQRVAEQHDHLRASARRRMETAQVRAIHLACSAADVARRWRRRLATAAVCLIAGLIAFHTIAGENGLLMYREKRVEYQRLQQQIEALQQENERLGRDIKALRSDPHAIEREAREQLRYARPGEVVYILPAPPASTPASPPATAERR